MRFFFAVFEKLDLLVIKFPLNPPLKRGNRWGRGALSLKNLGGTGLTLN